MSDLKLNEQQLAFLIHMRDDGPMQGTVRGLVRRGMLRYKWGNNASYGYVLTTKGRLAIQQATKP